jgi:enoyl-CoA hydratase/carnithine racemase
MGHEDGDRRRRLDERAAVSAPTQTTDPAAGKITTEKRGHVTLIGIDRAKKRNAFTTALYEDLGRAFAAYEKDDDAFCAVLFAHGEHFTGGLDLAEFAANFHGGKFPIAPDGIDPLGLFGKKREKPVVCAVQGICLTIGIELLLATDVRIAARDARFAQIEIKRGIYPVGGATIRFARETGWGNAMRWLLTGDEFGAEEALRIGLVQEVVAREELMDRAVALANVIAAQAPLGVRATIASARLAFTEGDEEAARRRLPDLQPILASDDAREGVQSFVERRAAVFRGR